MMLKPCILVGVALVVALPALGQVPVKANADHGQLLASPDPRLAANKRLAYDFFREVLEAGHLELASKYLAESYIQHNPNVSTGRAGFVGFFSGRLETKPIAARVSAPLVAIVAEGDLVILCLMGEEPDPTDKDKKYTVTWFDMFRVEGGKIAEHWDPALKQPGAPARNP